MDTIKIIFVLPNDCESEVDVSDIMSQAFECCKQNIAVVEWIRDSDLASEMKNVNKTDVIIFQDFRGPTFESLRQSKCAILGPWCVSICVMEGRPIPNFPWPIYNVAMSGCVVTCSNLSKSRKAEIEEKVQLMGGCYSNLLVTNTTHLVTDCVKSEKYSLAAEKGLNILTPAWVDAVWEASKTVNVHADGQQFKHHQLLPFHKLKICSTGFTSFAPRDELENKVKRNGGTFRANLVLADTDILVVTGEKGTTSLKYRAARRENHINCVTANWIDDCILKGYALPHKDYDVRPPTSTSTPERGERPSPNFSVISAIGNSSARSNVEETRLGDNSAACNEVGQGHKRRSSEFDGAIDGLDVKRAKRSGQYLDGCSIYTAGFESERKEKLSKILNLSGATRYDHISDRLTHIIIGDHSCPEVKLVKGRNHQACLVSIFWLIESMEKQRPADEEPYLVTLHDSDRENFSSPLGKKGLSLLRSKTVTPGELKISNLEIAAEVRRSGDEEDDSIMKHYFQSKSKVADEDTDTLAALLATDSNFADALHNNSSKNPSQPDQPDARRSSLSKNPPQLDQSNTLARSRSASNLAEISQEQPSEASAPLQDARIFSRKKFLLSHFTDEEEIDTIKDRVTENGGSVVAKNFKGIPDYIVAPIFVRAPVQGSAMEIVNTCWVFESMDSDRLCDILYYHGPLLVIEDSTPLDKCVITCSGYSGYEKEFLSRLVDELGGIYQEKFSRVHKPKQNILQSTHLVTKEAGGKKYEAAVKWGLPAVDRDWLMECAKLGRLAGEQDFLVGESRGGDKSSVIESTPRGPRNGVTVATPPMKPLNITLSQKASGSKSSPTTNSQVTPVNKIFERVRKTTNLLGTPQSISPLPKIYGIDTPPSASVNFVQPNMSPKSKKETWNFFNRLPDYQPGPEGPSGWSTPLDVFRKRCLAKFLGQDVEIEHNKTPTNFLGDDASSQNGTPVDSAEEPRTHRLTPQNLFLNDQINALESMVSTSAGSCRKSSRGFKPPETPKDQDMKDMTLSQPFTVQWDFANNADQPTDKPETGPRVFSFSGLEAQFRAELKEKVESLGAEVSDLAASDPRCTHLICGKLVRQEKPLAAMAAGKWILHPNYVVRSHKARKFLDEEDFEYGNPKSRENLRMTLKPDDVEKTRAMCFWRKQVSEGGKRAFDGMRAIVVASKAEPLQRVIESGGGQVVPLRAPFKGKVNATHCLLEPRSVPDFNVYMPLAQQGIYCVNTMFVSEFLYRSVLDPSEAILPFFAESNLGGSYSTRHK